MFTEVLIRSSWRGPHGVGWSCEGPPIQRGPPCSTYEGRDRERGATRRARLDAASKEELVLLGWATIAGRQGRQNSRSLCANKQVINPKHNSMSRVVECVRAHVTSVLHLPSFFANEFSFFVLFHACVLGLEPLLRPPRSLAAAHPSPRSLNSINAPIATAGNSGLADVPPG